MADSAADSAAAVEASAESDVAMTNCGGDADTATVSTGATGAGSTSSPPAATSGEGATSDVAAQLRAAVEAGRETDGGGMGGGEERSAEAPIGFCFSFPMKQSGMTTCTSIAHYVLCTGCCIASVHAQRYRRNLQFTYT